MEQMYTSSLLPKFASQTKSSVTESYQRLPTCGCSRENSRPSVFLALLSSKVGLWLTVYEHPYYHYTKMINDLT